MLSRQTMHMWKSNYSLNPITIHATLGSKNRKQAFAVTGNQSLTWLWRKKQNPDHHSANTWCQHCQPEVWLLMFLLKCCSSFIPGIKGLSPQKENFYLISPQNIFSKVLGVIKMFENKEPSWSAMIFILKLSRWMPFSASLNVELWTLTSSEPLLFGSLLSPPGWVVTVLFK